MSFTYKHFKDHPGVVCSESLCLYLFNKMKDVQTYQYPPTCPQIQIMR